MKTQMTHQERSLSKLDSPHQSCIREEVDGDSTMNVMAEFCTHVSAFAIESGLNHAAPKAAPLDTSNGYKGMQAVETVSLLGDHGGVADDFILGLLEEAAA